MKILQIITLSELGGAQSVLIELSNNLANLGHDVTVVSNPNGIMWSLLDYNEPWKLGQKNVKINTPEAGCGGVGCARNFYGSSLKRVGKL